MYVQVLTPVCTYNTTGGMNTAQTSPAPNRYGATCAHPECAPVHPAPRSKILRVYRALALSPDEVDEIEDSIGGLLGDVSTTLTAASAYDRLFEYFAFGVEDAQNPGRGAMPYGVAKCRTGDPDQWISAWLGVPQAGGRPYHPPDCPPFANDPRFADAPGGGQK